MTVTAILFNVLLIFGTFMVRSHAYDYKCVPQKDGNYICDAQFQEFDIIEEFRNLSETLPSDGKALKRLEIHNTYIEEIPESVFFDISFTYIEIFEAQNLMRIHSNAFNNNSAINLRQQIYISSPSKLRNYGDNYDMYKALNSLVNVADIEISLEAQYLHEIPDYAFKNTQINLRYLVFDESDYSISRIGSYAFSGLSGLTDLSFRYIPIRNISANAFGYISSSDKVLKINFEGCQISDSNIESGAFFDAKRPLYINLARNQLQYIREEKFDDIFKNNNQSGLEMYGNPLNCNNLQPFLWLLKQKADLESRVLFAKCANGTGLWDLSYNNNTDTTDSSTVSTTPSTTIPPTNFKCKVEYPDLINCNFEEYFDIKQEFQLISQTQDEDKRHFKQFLLYYSPIGELPENTFANITFDEISIHETENLTSIHKDAFNGPTANVTVDLILSQTTKLRNDPPTYDIYAAFSSFTNLKSIDICLESYTSHEIPTNAFRQINGPQNNLEQINFRGDFNISKINDNAFYRLATLKTWIHFTHIPVGYISAGAFDFSTSTTDALQIQLQNCLLTESSFEPGVFSGSQRPLYIDLSGNQIRFIDEIVFGPFFNSTYSGYINLESNPLECDQSFEWLLKRKTELEDRITNAKCKNGTLLWDLVDYECEIKFPDSITCSTSRTDFDIKKEFERISQLQSPDQKHFTDFYLSNTPINTLPENTFADITFNEISIHQTENLTSIHKNAFSGPTANVTRYLFLTQTNKLKNNPPDNDIYAAFSSLVNSEAIDICLESGTSHEIPEHAFSQNNGSLNLLEQIIFKGDFGISKIDNYAFIGLSNLKSWLTFSYIPIEFICARAFDLYSVSNNTLDINLQNCSLTESSFESGVFSGSQRPLNIDLRGNQIRFISQSVFGPFFDSTYSGNIDLGSNPLECDQSFEWLLKRKTELKDRIANAVCKNGALLWDLSPQNNFASNLNICVIFVLIVCLIPLMFNFNYI